MDVNRIESIAVPTVAAGVGAGAVGYLSATAIKEGKMTDKFVNYIADSFEKADKKLLKKADSLDKYNTLLTEEELKSFNGNTDKCCKYIKNKYAKAEKALRKFARKNAKVLGITPEKGQSLNDAVKTYLAGKNAANVKEDFLPGSVRRIIENITDYKSGITEEFVEVFDSSANKFKKDEAVRDSVKFFKRAAQNMKLRQAGIYAGVASGIALMSSAVASNISGK